MNILFIIFLFLIIYFLYRSLRFYKGKLYFNKNGNLSNILKNWKNINYKPTPWLINKHLHTVWGMRFRKRSNFECKREQFFFEDGGNTYLDWFYDENKIQDDSPILIIVHTLGGGTREPCTNNLAYSAMKKGWKGVVANCRGCSGAKFTSKKLFNAVEVDDLNNIILYIKNKFKPRNIYLVGFSLGAIQTIEYTRIYGNIDGVVCISHTYDPVQSSNILEKFPQSKLYLPIILEKLKNSLKKCEFISNNEKLNGLKSKTLREFDDLFTAKTLNMSGYIEYYKHLNIYPKISQIKIPLLIIGSTDDPFTSSNFLPIKEIENSNNVALLTVPEGGHVSFCEGFNGQNSFIDRIVFEWFEKLL